MRSFSPALEDMGGMHTELIELSAKSDYNFTGNYVLVLTVFASSMTVRLKAAR